MPDTVEREYHKLPSLRGIANKAKRDSQHRFRDLSRCLDEEMLRYSFSKLNPKATPGIDKQMVSDYASSLEVNLSDLVNRLNQDKYKVG